MLEIIVACCGLKLRRFADGRTKKLKEFRQARSIWEFCSRKLLIGRAAGTDGLENHSNEPNGKVKSKLSMIAIYRGELSVRDVHPNQRRPNEWFLSTIASSSSPKVLVNHTNYGKWYSDAPCLA
jgi:hypothetical protein